MKAKYAQSQYAYQKPLIFQCALNGLTHNVVQRGGGGAAHSCGGKKREVWTVIKKLRKQA